MLAQRPDLSQPELARGTTRKRPRGTQSLASIIAGRIHGGAAEHIPDKLTKRAAIQAL
jgi:hypothetical protein